MHAVEQPVVPLPPPGATEAAPGSKVRRLDLRGTQPVIDFVEQMNLVAPKLGLPPLAVFFGPMQIKEHVLPTPVADPEDENAPPLPRRVVHMEVFPIKVAVPKVRLPGPWRFVARVQQAGEDPEQSDDPTRVAVAVGMELPPGFPTENCACAQCRGRPDFTYVLRDQRDFTHYQLGPECLTKVLGPETPPALVRQFHFALEAVERLDRLAQDGAAVLRPGETGVPFYDVRAILPLAVAVVRRHGYLSGSQARAAEEAGDPAALSTRRRIEAIMGDKKGDLIQAYLPSPEDQTMAQETLAWLRGDLLQAQTTAYRQSLAAVARAPYFHPRHLSLMASAPSAYDQELQLRQERARQAAKGGLGSPAVSEGPGKTIAGLVPPRAPLAAPAVAPTRPPPVTPDP